MRDEEHALFLRQPRRAGEAAALLVHGAADFDGAFELDAGTANRFDRIHRRGDAGLHVAGASPVDAAVADDAAERIERPAGAGRDDVEMAVQVHRWDAPLGPRARADHVDAGMRGGVLGAALGGVIFDVEAARGEARADQPRTVEIALARRIDGRDADERGREVDDFVN